jgi:hypothetical protein
VLVWRRLEDQPEVRKKEKSERKYIVDGPSSSGQAFS